MPDEDLVALAGAIAGVPVEPPVELPKEGEIKGEVSPPPDEGKLDGLDLNDLEKAVKTLLEHPKLGPVIQRWADKGAAAQVKAEVRTAVEKAKGTTEGQVRQQIQEQTEDKFFEGLSQEELAQELLNPKAATAYARYQERKQQPSGQSQEQMDYDVKVWATASLIQTYKQLVEGSGLPADKQAKLQPEHFAHLGEDALVAWGESIYKALVETEVDKRWEAEKQDRLAELERARPDLTAGRRAAAAPDIMTTPSELLLEAALTTKEKERKGG